MLETSEKIGILEVHDDKMILVRDLFGLSNLAFLLWRLQSVLWSCVSAEEMQDEDHSLP